MEVTAEGGSKLNLPRLRSDQFEIAVSDSQIKVVACGRRWGKSLTARTIAFIIAAAGGRVAWVVPTYKNAKSTWREAEIVAKTLQDFGVVINKTEKTIEFPNGGFVGIYSADYADALRGGDHGRVIVSGDVENSRLVRYVVSGYMPYGGPPLSADQIQTLVNWVAAGAPNN